MDARLILFEYRHGEGVMRLSVWLIELIKLLGGRRLHPLNAECPFCHRMVRLHYNKAGRRHLIAHARAYSRALYQGSQYCAHYTAKMKCVGSGMLAKFAAFQSAQVAWDGRLINARLAIAPQRVSGAAPPAA
jgi:hypothetical protein